MSVFGSGSAGRKIPENRVENPEVVALAIAQGIATESVEADAIYVGNVDYNVTQEQLRQIFSVCGEVLRVTIPVNKKDQSPMGFAYLKFDIAKNPEAVAVARSMDGLELNGRKLKVTEKRINVPGLKTKCPYTEGHEHKESAPQLRTEKPNAGVGDWTCPACAALCYSFRTECFKCKAPKPMDGSVPMAPSGGGGPMRRGGGRGRGGGGMASQRYSPYGYAGAADVWGAAQMQTAAAMGWGAAAPMYAMDPAALAAAGQMPATYGQPYAAGTPVYGMSATYNV